MSYDYTLGTGKIVSATIQYLFGCVDQITNAMIKSNAAIATSKQVNRVYGTYNQQDGSNVAASPGDGFVLYTCNKVDGATIVGALALCQDVGSGGAPAHVITIDIKKWDESASTAATILSAAISITESQTDYEVVEGTLTDTDMDEGDVLYAVVTVAGSGGTAPQGLFVQVEVDEEGS